MKTCQIIKIAISLIVVWILGGCAATGAPYEQAAPSQSVEAEKVRLVLFRTRESILAAGRTASVKLDGKPVQGVKYAGFTFIDTNPGSHTLTVDLPDTYGKCLLPVEVAQGEKYFYQIRPRVEAFNIGGAIGGYLSAVNPDSPERKDCTGTFFIEEVEEDVALEKLKDLKSSQ